MKQTKSSDLRLKSNDELTQMVTDLKREQFNLRFQAASGQLNNTARVREVRRDIARAKTILGQRQQATTAKSKAA